MGAVRTVTWDTGPFPCQNDDQYVQVDLSFTFRGWPYVWVSNNGHLQWKYQGDGSSSPYGWPYALDPDLAVETPLTEQQWGNYAPDPIPRLIGIYAWMTDIGSAQYDRLGLAKTEYGEATIDGQKAFVTTWFETVPYGWNDGDPSYAYGSTEAGGDRRATFQVVLYEDGTFELNYDKLQYEYHGGGDIDWGRYDFGDGEQGFFMLPLCGYRLITYDDYLNDLNPSIHGDVDEFYDSRWLEILPIEWITTNPTIAEYDAYAFTNPLMDGGAKPLVERSNCGVAGRYVSTASFNIVPLITVDIALAATLVTDLPAPEGSIDLDIDTYYAGPVPVEAVDLYVIVEVGGLLASSLPDVWLDPVELDVQLMDAEAVDITPLLYGDLDVDVALADAEMLGAIFEVYSDDLLLDVGLDADLSVALPVQGSISLPIGVQATPAWGGLSPQPSATLSVVLDSRASYYYNQTTEDLNASSGGYWEVWGGAYGVSWGGWSTLTQSNVFSLAGHDYCLRFDHGANTNGSLTFMTSYHFGWMPWYAGLTYEYSVDVYVPSGYPAVKLEAYAGSPQEWGYWAADAVFPWPDDVVATATSTVWDAWQRITIVIPPTNDAMGWNLKFLSTDQSVASRWHMDNAQWHTYGPMVDPSWVYSGPNPNGDPSYYRMWTEGIAGGYYSNDSMYQDINSVVQTQVSRSGQAWKLTATNDPAVTYKPGYLHEDSIQRYYGADWRDDNDINNITLKHGAWVYVPSGNPPVEIGCTVNYYRRSFPYDRHYVDASVPAFSTKWDEWEYIETDMPYVQLYDPVGGGVYNDGWSNNAPAPYVRTAVPTDSPAEFYVDDVSFTPATYVPSPVLVSSLAHDSTWPVKRLGASLDLGLSATLDTSVKQVSGTIEVDIDVRSMQYLLEGSIDVDIDMELFSPYEVSVDGSITINYQAVVGRRYMDDWDIKGAPNWEPDWTPYNIPGFEGQGNYGTYDMDYWDSNWYYENYDSSWGDEFYMAYPWPRVRSGIRSAKYVTPSHGPLMFMAYYSKYQMTTEARMSVWVYNPAGNPPLMLRAIDGGGGVTFPIPYHVTYSRKVDQWERLELTLPLYLDPAPWWDDWREAWMVYFELGHGATDQRLEFYVDDYEIFYQRAEDPRVVYVSSA